ncbi:Insecticidal toxin complex protein TccB (plasmid) [Mycetohabitans rhizoxinica HKI 454]|uniref:Insecticidal toxin complex protein TccB n=1 Tax=Mycetohabitans rhizoxinica (strain DSM 19002 / CIP 109453 / HKI 454) TaxID=882378 RepID=E5AU93_MYCRK|nr:MULTISPECIES: neuraminidase-like domain-containing protein [Mycetohabitans]MCF7697310.1 insecticidal toxin complex protein TccB [Mycetohabitans sp. B2]MCG1048526.1 insecticidal toxin complex protein TccB [Mycetohabitans sp. B6]CBW76667.1 Insecticidal toxin complex protein TccB [Mycetohabitans rhizoxinica HKI 454]
MSASLFSQTLKEARRDALVDRYIATQVPADLKDRIHNANDLYEYLLLDTQISDRVSTSPLAEAISSLQLFIHRAIEGYDGALAEDAKSYFAQEHFLYNWDAFNRRYSTWAGKERLKFYAGNYIDPTLRLNKTQLFQTLEQGISQGKLSDALVQSKISEYLAEYNTLSNLEYIHAAKGGDEKTVFFAARTQNQPYKFYWRKLTLAAREDERGPIPIQWTEWREIAAGIADPYKGLVKLFWDKSRLNVCWYNKIDKGDEGFSCAKNIWCMDNNFSWASKEKRFAYCFEEIERKGVTGTVEDQHIKTQYSSDAEFIFCKDYFVLKNADSGVQPGFGVTLGDESGNIIKTLSDLGDYIFYNNDFYPKKILKISHGKGDSGSNYLIFSCNGSFSDFGKIEKLKDFINYDSYGEFTTSGNFKLSSDGEEISLSLTNNVDLPKLFDDRHDALFNYSVQKDLGGLTAFSGPYGMYLWEIFFHIPFLVAVRMQTEQRYDEANTWFKRIFNSSGYRDDDGNLLYDDNSNPRYWNVLPLQLDTAWDTSQPATTDPDVIAVADPMHYKLAIFLHVLDLLIARGDHAYRMLERDTLVEAKMYYIQAQQLLGPRPDIRITNTWPNPTLSAEAGAIDKPTRSHLSGALTFASWLRTGDAADMGDGHFLPPYNDVLLGYWDKLELRLYNLRHNLSLDGQPLNLPLYATPVDPAELQRQQAGGDDASSGVMSSQGHVQGWRYPLVADRARSAVGLLTQFGSSLQLALERQDNEKMTLLLQTQQQIVLKQQADLQQSNLKGLQHSLSALQASRDGATLRQSHFRNLIDGNLSAAEIAGLTLRSTAMTTNLAATGLLIAGGVADAVPNTFGLANGGSQWGAPVLGTAHATQAVAVAQDQSAGISEVTASYQRRQEEWQLQHDIAKNEVTQLDAQIKSLTEQIAMAQKQIALAETEQAHAQALYEFQTTRFTGQALYNWLAARLSALYYQLYDVTLPICLQAKAALVQELGDQDTDGVFRVPVWDNLWQGLLAGEGLSVELQKLDSIWLARGAMGLEATRTVSLATLFGAETFKDKLQTVLDGNPVDPSGGVRLSLTDNIFQATLDLSVLELDKSYNMKGKTRRIKSVAVTLPTLLGPYQDIEATLIFGKETATLSHGLNDSGRFVTDLNDSRFLPFEGMDVTQGTLSLNIFHAGKDDGAQRDVVANLNDIIVHLHYIIRDT